MKDFWKGEKVKGWLRLLVKSMSSLARNTRITSDTRIARRTRIARKTKTTRKPRLTIPTSLLNLTLAKKMSAFSYIF